MGDPRLSRKWSRLLIIVLLAITLTAPSIPQVQADSNTFQVNTGTDDCNKYGGTLTHSLVTIYWIHSTQPMEVGLRWTNVNIPQGSIIESAYLEWYSYSGAEPALPVIIEGDDEDNCLTFSTVGDFSGRPRTDATVTYNIPATGAGFVNSTDIKAVIQEIIDRPGWESGNALAILSQPHATATVLQFQSYNGVPARAAKLHVTWTPPPTDSIENKGIVPSDSTVNDEQWFFLNASIEVQLNTSTFLFNRIDLDPDGLNLSCSYTNATDTFVEESDPNNYLELDVIISVKTDENETFVRIDYYLRLHPNVTKDGLYNVTVYSTASGDLNDTDTYTDVFTLTIRTPSAPTKIFGAGFNASSPYAELHWTHDLLIFTTFEVQNSSDGSSWGYLGQNTTAAQYTDSQVVNGTERYYKVRACRNTGVGWKNTTFTNSTFETVYFVQATGNGNGDGEAINYPAIDEIEFNTTISEEVCGISGNFSDAEGLSGYIFWENVTSPPGGANSSFTSLTGTSDSALENITLPSSGTKLGVKYYVNDTDGNWGVDTLVIFPSAAEAGDTYVTGSIGIFMMAFIILLPIIFYAVKRK